MDHLINGLSSVYRPIQRNKFQFLTCLALSFGLALILSFTLGESFSWSDRRLRGPPRRVKRQTTQAQDGYKEPFPNRPRIQTKNGHLIIEASQDKNIDFKTSGSRGTITINGIKLDQLLNVSKALEKTLQQGGSKNQSKQSKTSDPYEMILENIYLSDGKLLNLERTVGLLSERVIELSKRLIKGSRQISKAVQQVGKIGRQQESLLGKLKQNECLNNETGRLVCKNGATCIDTFNGFKCICPPNYEGPTCEQDVDECARFHNTDLGCQNGAKCINLVGSYRCECPPQYHGVHCTEQHDDCSLSSSRSMCGYGKCINLPRTVSNQASFECICDQGWTTDGRNSPCVIDINECLVGQSYSAGLNISSDSSAPWSNSLMAAYPCSQNPYVECINLPGSFQCGPCPSGYTGNGRICRDIDECATNNGGCSTSPAVECINTQGSRQCGPCPSGYAGDGVTCNPAVACSLQPNGGCHPMAKCMDLPGASSNSRLCVCRYPYSGDGVGPDGCKNLQPGASNSSTNASIPYPFQLKQDDCHPNPCSSGSECLLTETSFECICRPGRIGRLCEIVQLKCGGEFFVSRGKLKFPFPGSFNDALKRPARQESKATDQHYDCYWRLSVASNMSVQLIFNELSNKVNPAKRIQMYLANSTDGPAPTCTESLDVRERLDSDDTNLVLTDSQPSSRLVARFCPDARGGKISSVTNKKPIIISTGSNSAELEYTFSETRTQFGEPSLAFDLNWTSVDPPCGGELPILETGSISSPNFPEFYKPGIECRYLIRVPYSHRVRLQFGELNLLTGRPHSSSCSDSLTIIDGAIGPDRPVLFKHCANNSTLMGKSQTLPAIISSGSIVEVVLISRPGSTTPLMRPKQKRGFYLTYASESTTPGCGGLFSQKSATIRSIDYEPSSMDANQRDNSMLALQMSRYFESKDSNSMYQPDQSLISSMFDFVIRDESPNISGSNGSSAGPMRRPRWFKTRCEYEIRPMNQSRDHKISLDWLDLPGEPVTEANAMSQWARRLRCNRARLTVYDGNPLDSSNRTEIARFCSGDRYNSSSLLLMPVTSSGHVLLLVYESRQSLDDSSNDMPPSGNAGSGSGFKLHYSTVCSAVYDQQSGEILVEISPEVPECIYHIMLPPNNTISLFVQPKTVDALNPVDGNCPAQAIFMDGAIQNSRLALIGVERQLKSYKFERTTELVHGNLSSRAGDSVVNDSMSTPKDEQDAMQVEVVPNSYWQYTWSPVHDIKEFEVCRLQYLDFDSIWNHMSLMFRMNQQQMLLNYKPKSQRLLVRYQAEPACGGIINEPREGSFVLESTKRVAGMEFYPLTSSRYDQLHQQEFTNPCAWILRAKSNQVINIEFEAPMSEINKRYNEWLNWKKTHNASALFNCSQVFQESIELYEPSLNRTRLLCLRDLFVDNSTTKWSTNSNIVYLRLHNTTEPSNGTSNLTWPSRRPLLVGNHVLTTKYKFVSVTNRTLCGGKLLHDSGVITSPRYPFNYPPVSNCTWIIQTNPGQQIRMNFSKFDLERQADCLFDYLELRNGQSDQSPLIGRFCNQDLQNQTIVAHSNTVLLTFRSDGHLSKQGFEISYDGALTGCGGKLKTANGQIDSPNYPQPYAHNSSCEWTIETGQSNRLELTFIDLDLAENSSFCQPDGLKTDYLEIIDYKEDNSTRSLAKLCSLKELKDGAIRSTRNRMSIVYHSQTLDNSRGFRLTYRTICNGPIELTSSNGVIESPGYPNDYSPHLKCHWIIRAPPRSNLTLNITDLDIEESINQSMEFIKRSRAKPICTADFLEIWARHSPISSLDPPQVNSTNLEKGAHLVQTLCGTMDRWTTNGSQPQLLFNLGADVANVKFESDRSIETRGFRLEWQSKS